LAAEKERLKSFGDIGERHLTAQLDSLKVFAVVQPLANVANGVSMTILIIGGGYAVIQGKLTLGIVVAFLGYVRNLYQPVRDLVEKYNVFLSAMVSAERVVGILEEPKENAGNLPISTHLFVTPETLPLSFKGVSFKYPTREEVAVDNISFDLPAGKKLALIGRTGSGKSTLLKLILRFYEPREGSILLGGIEVKNWDLVTLRKSIGVVHQEIYVFEGSLRDNLTLAQTGYSDDFLINVLKRAELWDFVESRGGLDLKLYEGGTNFSLGEKQLLSVARVLVMNPPVLFLDEATSSLDTITEKKVMAALDKVMENRTAIVIAHRLATIQNCDHILTL
jgi:ATP-binding cassette subfamily B protein